MIDTRNPLADAEAARMLAEAHVAQLVGAAARAVPRPTIAVHELWAHARRAPGDPVSLPVTRALRADPEVAARYRILLGSLAVAHAPFAIAASDGIVAKRQVGHVVLEILPADGPSPPLLVITGFDEARPPRLIEIGSEGETLRLALPEAVSGGIVLALDPAAPDAVRLGELVRDPRSEIFLV